MNIESGEIKNPRLIPEFIIRRDVLERLELPKRLAAQHAINDGRWRVIEDI